MGHVFFFGLFIEEGHRFARVLLVLLEIVVGAAGDAPEFLFAVGELKHQIRRGLRIEGKLVLGVNIFGDAFAGQADGDEPIRAGVDPLTVDRLPVGIR